VLESGVEVFCHRSGADLLALQGNAAAKEHAA
jgi:hypothetical protein